MKLQLQSVRLTMGGTLMKEGKLFEAMELFEQVKTPPGLYNLAQVKSKWAKPFYYQERYSPSFPTMCFRGNKNKLYIYLLLNVFHWNDQRRLFLKN